MDDESRSLLIAKLAGQILTRDASAVNNLMHKPELSLNEKLETLQNMVTLLPVSGIPSNATRRQTNSIIIMQNYVLRHKTLQIAIKFLRRASGIDVPTAQLDEMQSLLQQYEEYVNGDGSDNVIMNNFLFSAESVYEKIRQTKIEPYFEAHSTTPPQTPGLSQTNSPGPSQISMPGPSQISMSGPSQTQLEKLYALIEKYKNDPQAIERVENVEIKNVLRNIVRNVISQEVPLYKIRMDYEAFESIKDKNLKQLFNLYHEHKPIDFYRHQYEPLFTSAQRRTDNELLDSETESFVAEGPHITKESQFDDLSIDSLVDYIRYNSEQNIDLENQQSIQDMIKFAKNIWRHKNNLVQTPMHEQNWETADDDDNNNNRAQTPILLPQNVKTNDETIPSGVKRSKKRVQPLPEYSSDENDFDYEVERKRRREEDKNLLRLKALELSKYAGVNERMEKIVEVTKAMQQTYDYCNCKNTINGIPNANSFVYLLRRLNTYNLSHVEMTVNFYELLYPLTLYNDESSRIIGYIFGAANYFQNCAKNYEHMRNEFNQHGPFVQLDSLVMFVIKFNFLCDLQAFFGKIDKIPTLGQPNVNIHTVLVMRDKIVKLAFNALQYNIMSKNENKLRDPKHLQRLIMLMNGNFNIM
jgi:hypothetical protein